ncbi:MAG TPA: FlhC family transcriptional regulator [Steroidobacteraceae bacterium]|nr:FlhC family transcriptional regulator [Steroidobacteraceae bacterium]
MHISNERYFNERQRHDLALRMIRHEARTCTIRSCTGLTDDRIRRLYKTYASHMPAAPVRRRRGKSPRQVSFFLRNARAQLESSMLASVFTTFGLWRSQSGARHSSLPTPSVSLPSIEGGLLFCDAYETHRQLLSNADISFEHAWFLLQLLTRSAVLHAVRCRHCDSQYLRDRVNVLRRACPVCVLKRPDAQRR